MQGTGHSAWCNSTSQYNHKHCHTPILNTNDLEIPFSQQHVFGVMEETGDSGNSYSTRKTYEVHTLGKIRNQTPNPRDVRQTLYLSPLSQPLLLLTKNLLPEAYTFSCFILIGPKNYIITIFARYLSAGLKA